MGKSKSKGKIKKRSAGNQADPAVTKKRRFVVEITVEIDVSESLLSDVLTDEWRDRYYRFFHATEVAEHLAFNLLGGHDVSQLDGFADQPDDAAELVRDSMEADTTEGG